MNALHKLDEFRDVLSDYGMSTKSKEILKQTKFILLVAPTSAGRNTIIRQLLKTGDYHYIVSDTTRKPRINDGIPEQNGVEYWFRSEEEVLKDLRAGAYLEAAIIHDQQVSGISIYELEAARGKNKIAVTDIEIVGVENIMNEENNALPIFVLPPNFEEWQRRLKHRGEMNEAEVRRRMESASKEFAAALTHEYYSFIVNDTVPDAVARIHNMATKGKVDQADQKRSRKLAEALYSETINYLKNHK